MNFKFATAGQHPDDAAIISFTLQGNSLKPIAPTDLIASADESGNWHASMVGHPRESELPASFIMRFRRYSDGVLMRDVPAAQDTSFAVVFSDVVGGGYGFTVDNNLYPGTDLFPASLTVLARSAQEITGQGSFVEYTTTLDEALGDSGLMYTEIALIPSALDPWDGTGWVDVIYGVRAFFHFGAGAPIRLQAYQIGQDGLPEVVGSTDVYSPVKIRIAMVGTQVRFYVDWVNANSVPFARGVRPLDFPVRLKAAVREGSKIENLRIGGFEVPQTIYSTAQQTLDNEENGGTGPLDDITVEGWQVSPLTPPDYKGIPTPVTRFTY